MGASGALLLKPVGQATKNTQDLFSASPNTEFKFIWNKSKGFKLCVVKYFDRNKTNTCILMFTEQKLSLVNKQCIIGWYCSFTAAGTKL